MRVGPGGAVWLLAIGQTLTYAGVYYNFPALLPELEAVERSDHATLIDARLGWEVRVGVHAGPVVAGVVGVVCFLLLVANAAWLRVTGRRIFATAQLVFVFVAVMVNGVWMPVVSVSV